MFIKPRYESVELRVLRSLNNRLELADKKRNYYLNFEKGYAGEKKFDEWMGGFFRDNWLILNDLLLENKNSVFQIDSLLITSQKIYLFEIKNYDGDFYIEDNKWYTFSGTEINNPFSQLERCESSFKALLHEIGYNILIEPYVIFINPNFFLYQAPQKSPLIFPSQLNKLKNNLLMNKSPLNKRHFRIAEKLTSLHLKESPYTRLPKYEYNMLEKGVTCKVCYSFVDHISIEKGKKIIVCKNCSYKESINSAVLRSTLEYKLLFPDRKITTNDIFDWCKEINSKRAIRRILANRYKHTGHGKYSYFIKNDD